MCYICILHVCTAHSSHLAEVDELVLEMCWQSLHHSRQLVEYCTQVGDQRRVRTGRREGGGREGGREGRRERGRERKSWTVLLISQHDKYIHLYSVLFVSLYISLREGTKSHFLMASRSSLNLPSVLLSHCSERYCSFICFETHSHAVLNRWTLP